MTKPVNNITLALFALVAAGITIGAIIEPKAVNWILIGAVIALAYLIWNDITKVEKRINHNKEDNNV